MTPREHARLARALISACGGLEEAAQACRVSASKLSAYQNPAEPLYMPSDVMADLELYCGRPIFSAALAGRFDEEKASGDIVTAACDAAERTFELQRQARRAGEDGHFTPNELDQLAAAERDAEAAIERVRALRLQIEQRPRLKAVGS